MKIHLSETRIYLSMVDWNCVLEH